MKAALSVLAIVFLLAEPAHTQAPGSVSKSEKGSKHFWRDNSMMYGAVWFSTLTFNYEIAKRFPKEASFKRFCRNFVSLPEFKDGDTFVTNYIAHPLFGAFTYYVFWKQGYTAKQSFYATALQSTLFEYTVEGFVERPSGVDLIVTPLVGVPLGAKAGKYVVPISALVVIIRFAF